jgi:hypothetical protein
MNKKELREKLGASSVAEITTILRESGRDHQSQEVSDQDALFVESVYGLIKQGTPAAEAIQSVQGISDSASDSNKDHYIILVNQLTQKLQADGEEFWCGYYQFLPDAIKSASVLQSDAVKGAREKCASQILKIFDGNENQELKQNKEFFFSAIRQKINPAHKPQVEAPQQSQEVAA